jgi:hypothetical protein
MIRSLRGQGAALNKIADTIKNQIEGPLRRELGNSLPSIQNGTQPVPLTRIIQLALPASVKIAADDGSPVTVQQLARTLKARQADVVRVAGTNDAGLVADEIINVSRNAPANNIQHLKFDASIKAVCLAIASAMVLVQADLVTNPESGNFVVDPALQSKFNQLGEKVNEILFDPTSAAVRALKPNEDFRDNMHLLVIEILKTVQQKYSKSDSAAIQNLIANPPQIVTPLQLKSSLASHDSSIDPNMVTRIVDAVIPAIQMQFTTWLQMASKDAQESGTAEQSGLEYTEWAKQAMSLVDRMKVSDSASADSAELDVEEILAAGDEQFNRVYQAAKAAGKSEREALQAGEAAHAEYVNKEMPQE